MGSGVELVNGRMEWRSEVEGGRGVWCGAGERKNGVKEGGGREDRVGR